MTNHTDAIYTKNEVELPLPIELSLVGDNNQTEQQRDQLYRFSLCRDRNLIVGTYQTSAVYDEN